MKIPASIYLDEINNNIATYYLHIMYVHVLNKSISEDTEARDSGRINLTVSTQFTELK